VQTQSIIYPVNNKLSDAKISYEMRIGLGSMTEFVKAMIQNLRRNAMWLLGAVKRAYQKMKTHAMRMLGLKQAGNSCVHFQETEGCKVDGKKGSTKECTFAVPQGMSGYCVCKGADGKKVNPSPCGHGAFDCKTECVKYITAVRKAEMKAKFKKKVLRKKRVKVKQVKTGHYDCKDPKFPHKNTKFGLCYKKDPGPTARAQAGEACNPPGHKFHIKQYPPCKQTKEEELGENNGEYDGVFVGHDPAVHAFLRRTLEEEMEIVYAADDAERAIRRKVYEGKITKAQGEKEKALIPQCCGAEFFQDTPAKENGQSTRRVKGKRRLGERWGAIKKFSFTGKKVKKDGSVKNGGECTVNTECKSGICKGNGNGLTTGKCAATSALDDAGKAVVDTAESAGKAVADAAAWAAKAAAAAAKAAANLAKALADGRKRAAMLKAAIQRAILIAKGTGVFLKILATKGPYAVLTPCGGVFGGTLSKFKVTMGVRFQWLMYGTRKEYNLFFNFRHPIRTAARMAKTFWAILAPFFSKIRKGPPHKCSFKMKGIRKGKQRKGKIDFAKMKKMPTPKNMKSMEKPKAPKVGWVGGPAQQDAGLENAGKKCLQQCKGRQGPCKYCGKGLCCRFGMKGNILTGCDGTMGSRIRKAHVCVAKPGKKMSISVEHKLRKKSPAEAD